MEVRNVHIDHIFVDDGLGKSRSVRYEFAGERWVSTHTGRDGRRLGPITQLDHTEADHEENTSVVEFEEYELPTEGENDMTISYRDTWTIPSDTVYALVIPEGFISEHTGIRYADQEKDKYFHLNKRVTDEGNIFYSCIVEFAGPVNVQSRIREDKEQHSNEVEKLGTVTTPEDEASALQKTKENLPSASSVSLLLELRKLFGIP